MLNLRRLNDLDQLSVAAGRPSAAWVAIRANYTLASASRAYPNRVIGLVRRPLAWAISHAPPRSATRDPYREETCS